MADTRKKDDGRRRHRYNLYADSKLMHDARRVLRVLRRARTLVEALTEHDSNHIAHAFLVAGLDMGDEAAQYLLDEADAVVSDAQGFLWALNTFIRQLESGVPALPKGAAGAAGKGGAGHG